MNNGRTRQKNNTDAMEMWILRRKYGERRGKDIIQLMSERKMSMDTIKERSGKSFRHNSKFKIHNVFLGSTEGRVDVYKENGRPKKTFQQLQIHN